MRNAMIPELVRRARRRLLWNEIVAQGTCALAVAFGALVLLLLLGTQILDWRWLVILPSAAFGAGLYRVIRRLRSEYASAQLLDHRLNLADALSTAFYFLMPQSAARGTASFRERQREQAERLCRTVDLARAVPFRLPRAAYAAALLGLVATSLFALRYGLDHKLDLRPPLARILQQSFGGSSQQLASVQKKKDSQSRRAPLQDTTGISLQDPDGKNAAALDAAPDSAVDTSGEPDLDNTRKVSDTSGAQGKTPGNDPEGEDMEAESTDDAQSSNAGQNSADGSQGAGQSKQQGPQQAARQQDGSAGDKSSLMSKLRDAMSNLLSRMKQQSGTGSQQQSAMSQNGKEGRSQQGSPQQGRSGQSRQQQGGQESDSQEGQQGQDSQNAQDAQARGGGQSSEEQSSKQPGSGIGRQDGSKDVKLAEQLAAMGKISEIIGKRSANVTGDVTVEVQSGSQQLRTQYAQKNAEHSNAGGEISRDEVPVAFQAYVQQYFEQVRKQESAPAPKDAGKRKR